MNINLVEQEQADRIESKLDQLMVLIREVADRTIPEWLTLREVAELKGIPYNTVRKHKEWQPNLMAAELVGNVQRWPRTVVLAWLSLADKDMGEDRLRLVRG